MAYTLGAASAVLGVSSVQGAARAWELIGPRWSGGLMGICGLDVRVEGQANLIEPAVFVANHQSFLDPMLLTAVLPVRTKWVAKGEFRRVPLLGRAFGVCAIYVNRSDPSAARASLSDGLEELPDGWSVAVFPEGTRTRDGALQRFKKGAFHLALRLKLPVVPLGVAADPATLPRNPGLIRPGAVHVDVGPPVSTDTWKSSEAEPRMAELHAAVSECLARARERASSAVA